MLHAVIFAVPFILHAVTVFALILSISAEGNSRQTLNWTQRISAAIGIAKGIQFLHTGIVPGMYSNRLKITDILLDHNLVAKISSYNLPLLAESMRPVLCLFPFFFLSFCFLYSS